MKFTKDDALDILAHVVYKRRVKCREEFGIGGEGSPDGDRRQAEYIWAFFENCEDRKIECAEDVALCPRYEDYEVYDTWYQFLKGKINN